MYDRVTISLSYDYKPDNHLLLDISTFALTHPLSACTCPRSVHGIQFPPALGHSFHFTYQNYLQSERSTESKIIEEN